MGGHYYSADDTRLEAQLKASVSMSKAREVVTKAYVSGQSKATTSFTKADFQNALAETRFPWSVEKTVKFSVLTQAYLVGLNHRGEHSTLRPPSKASLSDYEPSIRTFIEVMGDMNIGSIDRAMVGQFYTAMKALPPNINKLNKFRGKSVAEIIEMGEQPQSASNIAKKMGCISTMFKWALEEREIWGIDKNPFSGYALSKRVKKKSVRSPFKDDDLKRLLSHPTYEKKQFERSWHFWLIPLGLFTGARQAELCQLEVNDFKKIDDVYCIDLTDEEESKRLKNNSARRLIPIHPELMRMGLWRHVERLRERGEKFLFDDAELSPHHKRGKGHYASKWFASFRQKVGINGKQAKVFHSFRHTFITRLLDHGITTTLISPIVGHESGIITESCYFGVEDAVNRKPTVEAFRLPDDILQLFPNVEDVFIGASRKALGAPC